MAATEFIELLGNQLAEGTGGQICEGVEGIFKDAINNLPHGNLKASLKKNFKLHLKKLMSHVKSVSEKHKFLGGPNVKEIKFNLYRKDSINETLQSVSALQSDVSREYNCKRLWAAASLAEESERVLQTLKPQQDVESDELKTADEKLDSLVRIINTCKQIGIGYSEQKMMSCMKFMLGEISPICEECLCEPDENSKQKRAIILRDVLRETVLLMHFRHQPGTESVCSGDNEESFEDLLAALLSLYIDMVLISVSSSDQDKKKLAKKTGNFVFLLLGNSVGHCLDVLLQLSAVSHDNLEVILPLIRCALTRTSQADLSCSMYIKCVCTARLGLKHTERNNRDERNALKQVVESILSPPQFISWLSSRDKGLVEDLCLTPKTARSKLTKHLLKVTNEECFERLLDLASNILPETKDDIESKDNDDQSGVPDELGFFIDPRGDTETFITEEEKMYTTSRAKEKFLEKQLLSLRSRVHSHSESDSEDNEQFDFEDGNLSNSTFGVTEEPNRSSGLDSYFPIERNIGTAVEGTDSAQMEHSSKLDSDIPIERNIGTAVEETDSAQMENNSELDSDIPIERNIETAVEGTYSAQMENNSELESDIPIERNIGTAVEGIDNAQTENSTELDSDIPVDRNIGIAVEGTDSAQTENISELDSDVPIERNTGTAVEGTDSAQMENSSVLTLETQTEGVDDCVKSKEVASAGPQVENTSRAEKQHTTTAKPLTTKSRSANATRKRCKETGVITRAQSSLIKAVDERDILQITNEGHSAQRGRKRKSKETTLHEEAESSQQNVKKKQEGTTRKRNFEPRRISTRLRKLR